MPAEMSRNARILATIANNRHEVKLTAAGKRGRSHNLAIAGINQKDK